MQIFQNFITRPAMEPSGTSANQQRPTQGRSPLILVILLDATGSMQPYIEGIRQALNHVVDILKAGAFDAILGMVVFRDEKEGEMPHVYPLGSTPDELKGILAGVTATGGGDEPESSYPAIMHAIDMLNPCYQNMPRVFLHITDAPPHDPEAGYTAKDIQNALHQHDVIFSCCTLNQEPYRSFANATGGTLFPIQSDMESQSFKVVLMNFARTTVKTVRAADFTISPEVREALRKASGRE